MIKFQSFQPTTDIFKSGTLTSLASDIYNGIAIKDLKRLSVDQFAQIPSIYGCLEPNIDIHDINSADTIKTSNGNEIKGGDLKAISMLMYTKPRTAYIEYKSTKQVHEVGVSGACPIPMLGFKRFRNIKYDTWRTAFADKMELDDKLNIKRNPLKEDEAIRLAFKIDMMLGKSLASTYYDDEDDTIKWKDKLGLLTASLLQSSTYTPTIKDIAYLREVGMGNYKGHFATSYGTARVPEKVKGINPKILTLYNKCDTPMRLMLAQRWAWFGKHRSDDLICDFQNWDNMPKDASSDSVVFEGFRPKSETKSNIGNMFGVQL